MPLSDSAIRELRQEAERLRAEADALESYAARAEAERRIQPHGHPTAQVVSGARPLLSGLSLPEAILTALGKYDRPLNARQLGQELKAGGINVGKMASRIAGELARLKRKGKVRRVERGLYEVAKTG